MCVLMFYLILRDAFVVSFPTVFASVGIICRLSWILDRLALRWNLALKKVVPSIINLKRSTVTG
jgi:hypothetical protein